MLLSRPVVPRGEVAASMLAWMERKSREVTAEVAEKQHAADQLVMQAMRRDHLLQSFSTRYMRLKGLFHARGLLGAARPPHCQC